RHTNHQIATDGSQKINQRILQPLRDRMARSLASPLLEMAVACWVAYLAKSQPGFAPDWEASDHIMPFAADIAKRWQGDIGVFTRTVFDNRAIFGDGLAQNTGFIGRVGSAARIMLEDGVAKALAGTMAGAPPA